MRNLKFHTVLFTSLLFFSLSISAQDRFSVLQQRLNDLSQNITGLNQKVETAVSNVSLYEFLRGLAATHNLNFNVDPGLTQKITSYFSNETVKNLLLYLARQYDLEFNFTGTIITIFPYKDPFSNLPPPPKELKINYDPPTKTITMDLQNDSLVSMAKKMTQLSGQNIIVLPDLFNKKITGYYQSMTIEGVLDKIALANGLKLSASNDGALILDALKPNEQIVPRQNLVPNANYSIRQINSGPNGNSSGAVNVTENRGRKLISLNASSLPIKDVIKSIAEQASINYFVYSELTGTTTASVQNMPFDSVLNFVLQGSNYTYGIENGVYMIGNRQDEGLRSYKLIQLKYRSVDSLLPAIPREIIKGVDIKEFKELNGFLLSGSEPQIKEIQAFVKELDKTVPMVMIEVILMDVQKTRTVETGLQLGVSDSVRSGGTLLGAGTNYTFSAGDVNRFIGQLGINNVFNLGRVAPNFYASLRALETNSNIELRQTPKLSTLNGHVANLSIGSTRYYAVTTQNVLGSLNPQTVVTQQFYPVEANMAIRILPFVSGDEHITLTIDINISDFIGATPVNEPPPTASSKFSSIIRVKNEEMVVLGGIERNEKRDEGTGTPLLSRIPILKWLFSSKKKINGKTVSIVFIKPTIIY